MIRFETYMSDRTTEIEKLKAEIRNLQNQVEEAQDTIQAIRTGQIDALVVEGDDGHQVFSLKSADHSYRVFIETMKEGAVTLDRNGNILYSNSQFADMVGKTLNKVLGAKLTDFIYPTEIEKLEKIILKAWNTDGKAEIFFKKGRQKLPFLLSYNSLELDSGPALSIICSDLSKHKKIEKLLKQQNEELESARQRVSLINEQLEAIVTERTKDLLVSREHFKFLANNIPVIVWTARPDGIPDYFNKKWSDYTGIPLERSVGQGWQSVLHIDDHFTAVESWKESIEKEKPYELECRIRNAVGVYRWHFVNAIPFRDETGHIVTWLGTCTDIEERKMELDKKDEFIGIASHELKTPLTSLKGYMQLLEEMNKNSESSFYLKKANDAVGKLQLLINDLLDVSKIQSGKLEFAKSPTDLSDIVKDTVESCIHMYPGFTFEHRTEPGLHVIANPDRLEQVIMNLISNAVKYSGNNKKVIVEASRFGKDPIVSIKDFGIGLSENDKKLVFDRFYRVDSHKHISSGLGMGLFIASEIVKAHGGKLEVNSKLNQGSIFSFTLPGI